MVIIMRFINSLASTSFTRTSSLSARSLTVMPFGERDGARDRRRRRRRRRHRRRGRPLASRLRGPLPGPVLAERRALAERRTLTGGGGWPGMPGRACAAARRTGCDGQRPRSAEHAGRRCRPRRRRDIRRGGAGAPGRAAPAGRPSGRRGRALPVAPAGGCAAGGWTMRACLTGGRLAGASGRAGCGVCPGSSMRRRSVGGTKRPGDWRRRGRRIVAAASVAETPAAASPRRYVAALGRRDRRSLDRLPATARTSTGGASAPARRTSAACRSSTARPRRTGASGGAVRWTAR